MIERLKKAAKGMGKVRKVRLPNRLRALRLEALRVLDEDRPNRVSDRRLWVQSYIALRTR